MTTPRWLPLESNPDVINSYISNIGVPKAWHCQDVFGLDEEMLSMIPKPVAALLLLFPISDKYESFSKNQVEELEKAGQKTPANVFFMPQTIGNACGTVALIHALANNQHRIKIGGILDKFLAKATKASQDERAKALEADKELMEAHEASAAQGQTQAPGREEKVDLHFICFIHKDGILYELDGRKPFPIAHGKTSEETLLADGARVAKEFMARDPDTLNFTAIALCGK